MAKRRPKKPGRNYSMQGARKPFERRRGARKRKKSGRIPALLIVALLFAAAGGIFLKTRIPTLSEEDYPASLIALAKAQPEALEFVKAYPNRKEQTDVDVSGDLDGKHVPLFLQWDLRWGYTVYGDDYMAITGCGPTCLSMVYTYLTGDGSMHPGAMASWAEREGFYVPGAGSSWSLMDQGAEALGLPVETTSLSEGQIADALSEGKVIICTVGPGDFTTEGHFIVLAGLDEQGKVIVNDPNSRERSSKTWDPDRIVRQIKQFWIYEAPAI